MGEAEEGGSGCLPACLPVYLPGGPCPWRCTLSDRRQLLLMWVPACVVTACCMVMLCLSRAWSASWARRWRGGSSWWRRRA